jgi:hypothetical protein
VFSTLFHSILGVANKSNLVRFVFRTIFSFPLLDVVTRFFQIWNLFRRFFPRFFFFFFFPNSTGTPPFAHSTDVNLKNLADSLPVHSALHHTRWTHSARTISPHFPLHSSLAHLFPNLRSAQLTESGFFAPFPHLQQLFFRSVEPSVRSFFVNSARSFPNLRYLHCNHPSIDLLSILWRSTKLQHLWIEIRPQAFDQAEDVARCIARFPYSLESVALMGVDVPCASQLLALFSLPKFRFFYL